MRKIILILSLQIFLFASNIETAIELFKSEKYTEALKIFHQHKEDSTSLYYIGASYFYGEGVKRDYSKAFEYAKKSADKNNPAGIYLLSALYYGGLGTAKDEKKSFELLITAANMGNPKAMWRLGLGYQLGKFLPLDDNAAIEWFKKAISKGESIANIYLANTYYYSDNYEKALKYYLDYEKSNEKNKTIEYKAQLGDVYKSFGKSKKAYENYLIAANGGNDYAMMKLCYLLQDMPKLSQNPREAEFWALNVLNLKQSDFKSMALTFLRYYYHGITNEPHKAFEIAKKEYESGNKDTDNACSLATCYIADGAAGEAYEYDPIKAFEIANSIIKENPEKSISECYMTLSVQYQNGQGVAKDYEKAINYLKRSFETTQGARKASPAYLLGDLYLKKLNDHEIAHKWYTEAYRLDGDTAHLKKVEEYKKKLPKPAKQELVSAKDIFPLVGSYDHPDKTSAALESQKYYFMATDTKGVNVYDKNTHKLIRELRTQVDSGVYGAVFQMAFDEKKELLYCIALNSTTNLELNDIITVFDIHTGKVVKTLQNKQSFSASYLNISSDGKYLISLNSNFNGINIIDTNNGNVQQYNGQSMVKLVGAKIDLLGSEHLAKVLDEQGYLHTYSIEQKRQISKEKATNEVTFKTFNSKDADKIFSNLNQEFIKSAYISGNTLNIKTTKNKKLFDLEKLELQKFDELQFDTKKHSSMEIVVKNNNSSFDILKNGKVISSVSILGVKILAHRIINDKFVLISTNALPYVFNLDGKVIAELKGVVASQGNISHNDRYVVTFGVDNVVHIWDFERLKDKKASEEFDMTTLSSLNKIVDGNILDVFKISVEEGSDKTFLAKVKSAYGLDYTPTLKEAQNGFKIFLTKKEEIYPLASLHIKNDEWALFDHLGFFASSPNGTNLIRYHQNQGFGKEAKIIDNSQLYEKLYRPDIMLKKLSKQKVDTDIDVKSIIKKVIPPKIRIVSSKMTDDKNLDIIYEVCDGGSGISNTSLVLNGVEINPQKTRGFSIVQDSTTSCKAYKNAITLPDGENTIEIRSFDKDKIISSTSNKLPVKATSKQAHKPNLHFVSLAVSKYKNKELDLKYPVMDSLALKNTLQSKSKNVFGNIFSYELHDSNVTSKEIDKLFNKISNSAKADDIFVLYLAGHGKTDEKDGLYYFYTHDDSLSVSTLRGQISKIQAQKSLILIDTCNSGGAIDSIIIGGRLSEGNKRDYIVASGKNQYALEGYKNHGIFTYTILDSFEQFYPLTRSKLAVYVEEKVPEISLQKFHYKQEAKFYLPGENFALTDTKKATNH